MSKKESNPCDECGKDKDSLYAYEGFLMTSYVEFLCEKCYYKKHGRKVKQDFNLDKETNTENIM